MHMLSSKGMDEYFVDICIMKLSWSVAICFL